VKIAGLQSWKLPYNLTSVQFPNKPFGIFSRFVFALLQLHQPRVFCDYTNSIVLSSISPSHWNATAEASCALQTSLRRWLRHARFYYHLYEVNDSTAKEEIPSQLTTQLTVYSAQLDQCVHFYNTIYGHATATALLAAPLACNTSLVSHLAYHLQKHCAGRCHIGF